MVFRIYLPTWSSIFGNRNRQPATSLVDSQPTDEEHVVYLDTDTILLPTKPPPPYAAEDPNPVTRNRFGRRPVAVLRNIEYIEQTSTFSNGDSVTTRLAMRESDENRRLNITRRRRRKEWELSQAVLSVIIFFLAIVGIAWLGSVAVAWTWPEKTESLVVIKLEAEMDAGYIYAVDDYTCRSYPILDFQTTCYPIKQAAYHHEQQQTLS